MPNNHTQFCDIVRKHNAEMRKEEDATDLKKVSRGGASGKMAAIAQLQSPDNLLDGRARNNEIGAVTSVEESADIRFKDQVLSQIGETMPSAGEQVESGAVSGTPSAASRKTVAVVRSRPPRSVEGSTEFASLSASREEYKVEEIDYEEQSYDRMDQAASAVIEDSDAAAKARGPDFKDQVRDRSARFSGNGEQLSLVKSIGGDKTGASHPIQKQSAADMEEGTALLLEDEPVQRVEIPGQGVLPIVSAKLIEETPELEVVRDTRRTRRMVATTGAIAVVLIVAVGLGVYFGTRKNDDEEASIPFESTDELYQAVDLILSGDVAGTQVYADSIRDWDVSRITNFSHLFDVERNAGAQSFEVADLNSWNVGEAVTMHAMFRGAALFNGNITTWDTSGVTDFGEMFEDSHVFNQPLSRWNTSSVTEMGGMFAGAKSFNQDLSNWDTSSVIEMSDMFHGAEAFNQSLASWNLTSVTNTSLMFSHALSFDQDISSWDVAQVQDMRYMFFQAGNFTGTNLSKWDVGQVSNMEGLFYSIDPSFNEDISDWDVSNVERMNVMLYEATSFNQPLSNWNTMSLKSTNDMVRMELHCVRIDTF